MSINSTPKMNLTDDFRSTFSQFKNSFYESCIAQRNFENWELPTSKTLKNSNEYYFLEPTGSNPDGIWIRKKPDLKLPSESEVIRKSKYDLLKVTPVKDGEVSLSKFIPKTLINEFKEKCKSNRDWLFSSSKSGLFKTTNSLNFRDLDKSPKIFGIDNEKELESLEIIGSNKLLSEISAWYNIQGPKFFMKNHYYTETGEGEPDDPEEVIEQSYY